MMTQTPSKTRILVVDDSAVMRKLISEILVSDDSFEVVGTAPDPYVAREKIKALNPDVLTLDIEMPKMDGITFLSNLMRLRPMPVVMVSTLTTAGAEKTLRALELGAIDFVTKPKPQETLEIFESELLRKVKAAAMSQTQAGNVVDRPIVSPEKIAAIAPDIAARTLIAIGASTGGTEAIKEVLVSLPANAPGIVIAQHIPPIFSQSFAKRMDQCCPLSVKEAEDGDEIVPGRVLIAPGDFHLTVVRKGQAFQARLNQKDPVNFHRPSVDVLFDSVAETVGRDAIGVILTGMGKDGAAGLKRMRDAGAPTLAQDKESCVVWGMPRAAENVGAVEASAPLNQISSRLTALLTSPSPKELRSVG